MDHATKFCHRHSLNSREAAAHFQGHTERHTSSAQLFSVVTRAGGVIVRDAHSRLRLAPICSDILFQKPEKPKPALELEDDEENSSLSR